MGKPSTNIHEYTNASIDSTQARECPARIRVFVDGLGRYEPR